MATDSGENIEMSATQQQQNQNTTTKPTAESEQTSNTNIPKPTTPKIKINNKNPLNAYENARELGLAVTYSPTHSATPSPCPSPSPQAQTSNDVSIKVLPTSRQLFHEAAAEHGGDETTSFLQQELASTAATQPIRLRSASSTLDNSISRNPSMLGSKHEKKIGHRRVDEGGEVTYKKIKSKQIMGSIQLGIQHTVGSLASKPKRDLLMNDFWEMETISFPPDGSSLTPAHHYNDFRFKVYAPIAFRYFRDLFGIAPDDFLMSMCASPLRELSNPGASGSIFYLTEDDEFIIKTVQKKECEFLQKLLPGYYMNLSQNPRTLLPKFFGLFCFNYNSRNVRLVAMNNLLPSDIKMHAKYDLKGSTFRRKASKTERQKASPTFKDLDFMEHHPNGIFLETDKYNALMNTIKRDCMVLESFQIMDYSLLVGIHNLDLALKEKREERIRNARAKLQRSEELRESDDVPQFTDSAPISIYNAPVQPSTSSGAALHQAALTAAAAVTGTSLNRSRSMNRQRLVAHSTAMESITADIDAPIEEDEDVPAGGIPARSENDERLILYIGIIDILQSYRLEKKLEHTFKSIIYNGDTVSVCRPSFYAQRFQNFMGKTVFKKTPTFPLKNSLWKRKTSTTVMSRNTPQRTPSQHAATNKDVVVNAVNSAQTSYSNNVRPQFMSGMSTPPPAFDDISEEDVTATSSTAMMNGSQPNSATSSGTPITSSAALRNKFWEQSSTNRSAVSSSTENYSNDDFDLISENETASRPSSTNRWFKTRSPQLSKTNVHVTTIGCIEDADVKRDFDDAHDKKIVADHRYITEDNMNVQSNTINVNDRIEQNVLTHSETSNENGGKHIITKTTVIKNVQAQKYTTTLVVNDDTS